MKRIVATFMSVMTIAGGFAVLLGAGITGSADTSGSSAFQSTTGKKDLGWG